MKILYCRIGWMKAYNGMLNDELKNGGEYNKLNVGHEIYNFSCEEETYYGYVQSKNNTITIQRINDSKKSTDSESLKNVLVVWVARNEKQGGQFIVGWYNNATVYRTLQELPDALKHKRNEVDKLKYNISSKDAILLPEKNRNKRVVGMGQSNIWYGNESMNKEVADYINKCNSHISEFVSEIETGLNELVGYEKLCIVKSRVNQNKFREILLKKHNGRCCLCNLGHESILIASHIKPWSNSADREKVDEYNGLLLCPNHDKLFDTGLISFDDVGNLLISKNLLSHDRVLTNVHENMNIEINEYNIDYIRYHRNKVFKK